MSLLDQITGLFGGGSSATAQPGSQAAVLQQILTAVLGPQAGGLAGLLAKFQSAGLGDIVASWVGTGANQPVTPGQVQQALGPDHVQAAERSTGLTKEQILALLSQHLPGVVDHVTPDGQVPENASSISSQLLTAGLSYLKSRNA